MFDDRGGAPQAARCPGGPSRSIEANLTVSFVNSIVLRGGGEVMSSVLERAASRGESRENISPRVARLPLDLLRHELILTHQPPSQRVLEEIVDDIFLPLALRNP